MNRKKSYIRKGKEIVQERYHPIRSSRIRKKERKSRKKTRKFDLKNFIF